MALFDRNNKHTFMPYCSLTSETIHKSLYVLEQKKKNKVMFSKRKKKKEKTIIVKEIGCVNVSAAVANSQRVNGLHVSVYIKEK